MAKRTAGKSSGAEGTPAKAEGSAATAVSDAPAPHVPYVVFARRFRPNNFAEVAGQTAVTHALRQSLTSGRLHQAYLFCGPRGVGKTSLARIFAKALNCLKGSGPGGIADEPCNACEACLEIQDGSSMDVVEMDAATNRGIEEIRSLRDNVGLAPARLRFKVYIIDEVHMLTKEAWNAFLKTLEEPPAHVKFIFATTDPNNVPETILSRCQRYDLRRIGPADIIKRLKQICGLEKVEFEEMALSRIASISRGGLRDAEGLLDQAVNLGAGKVTDTVVRDLSGAAPDELVFDVLKSCAKGDTANVLTQTHVALEAGADPDDMLESMTERLRCTLLAKVCGADTPLLEGQMHLKAAIAELSALLSEDQMLMLIQLFNAARRQTKDAAQARLPLEMALIRASRAGDLVELGKLVKAMEASVGAGGPPKPGSPQGSGPPSREGPRPNSPGRPVDTDNVRPAATPTAGVQPVSAPSGLGNATVAVQPAVAAQPPVPAVKDTRGAQDDAWTKVLAAMKNVKGGAFLHGALAHAKAVSFDALAGRLELGFSTDQLLYSDAIQKTHNLNEIKGVLTQLFGREFAVSISRVGDTAQRREVREVPLAAPSAAAPARPIAPVAPIAPAVSKAPARPVVPQNTDSLPEDIIGDEGDGYGGGDETEIEFDSPGELPLPARPAAVTHEYERPAIVPPPLPISPRNEALRAPTPPARPAPGGATRPTQTNPSNPAPGGANAAVDRELLMSVQDHPLIQMIVKETGGTVMRVEQARGKKPKPEKTTET